MKQRAQRRERKGDGEAKKAENKERSSLASYLVHSGASINICGFEGEDARTVRE